MVVGCITPYTAELPSSETNALVIEGNIVSGEECEFYLSKSVPLPESDVEVPLVSDASICVTGEDGLRVEGQCVKPGRYIISVPVLNPGVRYSLEVNYNGDIYTSEPQQPLKTLNIDKVEGSQQNRGNIDILITAAMPDNKEETQYFRWTYEEVWEMRPEYKCYGYWDMDKNEAVKVDEMYPSRGWRIRQNTSILTASSVRYADNHLEKYKLYDIPCNDDRTKTLYCTNITQRSISKAEYEYESERIRVSTEMGGLFTPQPSALPTNIRCMDASKRVIGFVGCSMGVARYRFFVSKDDYYTYHEYNCKVISETDPQYSDERDMTRKGYELIMWSKDDLGVESRWTTHSCVDITNSIDVTEKPDYWPN